MSKHTPGPWALDESWHKGCINRLEPYRHIGMVSAYQAKAGDREENEANAKLIAAAPDLLEALEWALDYAQEEIERASNAGGVGMQEDFDMLKRAKAAIAKARGEA